MPPIEVVIVGRDESGGALQSAQSGIGGIGQIAAGILASGIFQKIAGAVVDFGKDVIEKSADAQKIQAAFQAQLEATGHAADGTAELVDKYAQQILKTTTYDDDAAKASATVFLGFKRIGQDVLPQAIQASADLAAKLGIDMPSAAAMVAKALGGDLAEGGIGKLNTAFKLFDKEQLKVVEDMAAAGNQAGAQKMILDALNGTVGGQAAAAGKTFEGSWQRIQNQLDNVKENLGGPLLDALAGVFDQLANTGIFDALGEVALQMGKDIAAAVPFLIKLMSTFQSGEGPLKGFNSLLGSLSNWWTRNSPPIIAKGQELFQKLQIGVSQIAAKLEPFINTQLSKFDAWFTENGPLIVKVIMQIADGFIAAIPFVVSFFDVILPYFGDMITVALELSKVIMQVFTGDFAGAWDGAQKAFDVFIKSQTKIALGFINWILSFFRTSLSGLGQIFSDKFNQMVKATQDAFDGMALAVSLRINEIQTTIQNTFNNIVGVIGTKMGEIQTAVQTTFNNIVIAVSAKINEIQTAIQTTFSNVVNAISEKINQIRDTISNGVSSWIGTILDSVDAFRNAGAALLNGIREGINNNLSSFASFLNSVILNAINNALAALGLPPLGTPNNPPPTPPPDSMGGALGLRMSMPMPNPSLSSNGAGASTYNSNIKSNFYNFGTYNGSTRTSGNSAVDRLRR